MLADSSIAKWNENWNASTASENPTTHRGRSGLRVHAVLCLFSLPSTTAALVTWQETGEKRWWWLVARQLNETNCRPSEWRRSRNMKIMNCANGRLTSAKTDRNSQIPTPPCGKREVVTEVAWYVRVGAARHLRGWHFGARTSVNKT